MGLPEVPIEPLAACKVMSPSVVVKSKVQVWVIDPAACTSSDTAVSSAPAT